jgi:RNA polymerase sigma factor (sigma-70 family)
VDTSSCHASDEAVLAASADQSGPFSIFYRRHAVALLAFFARRTFDGQVAADLMAETMAEAYASRQRYRDRGPGSAYAWLMAIARHKLSHYLRHLVVEERARRRLSIVTPAIDADDLRRIEELIDFEQIGRAVATAFCQLRSEQREALRLRVLEGRSYAEAARLLGCSEQAVRARVSRGLHKLARHLELANVDSRTGTESTP